MALRCQILSETLSILMPSCQTTKMEARRSRGMPLERTETALGSTIGCLVDQSMSDELQAPQSQTNAKSASRRLARPDWRSLNLEFQIGKHEASGLVARTVFLDCPRPPRRSSYSPSQYRMAGRDCGDAGTCSSSGLRLWDRHLGIQTRNSLLGISRLPCGGDACHGLDGTRLLWIPQSHYHRFVTAFADNRLVRLRLGKTGW